MIKNVDSISQSVIKRESILDRSGSLTGEHAAHASLAFSRSTHSGHLQIIFPKEGTLHPLVIAIKIGFKESFASLSNHIKDSLGCGFGLGNPCIRTFPLRRTGREYDSPVLT